MNNKSGQNKLLIKYLENYALITIFVIIIIVFSILMPKFFSFTNLINLLVQAAPLGIATVGMTFVIIQGGIDLAAGSSMYLGIIFGSMLLNTGAGLVPIVVVSILGGALIGAINGFMISRFNVIPFIATLGTMVFGRALGLTLSNQKTVLFNDEASSLIVNTKLFGIPIIIFVLFLILAGAQFLLSYTSFGRHLYAIGNNEIAAVNIGIKVRKIRFIVYLLCGAFSGLSGLIIAAQSSLITTALGQGNEFVIISAAVLGGVSLFGGKGKIFPGVLIGILIISIIENGMNLIGANPYSYQIVRGIVIAVAVMFDSINYRGELR